MSRFRRRANTPGSRPRTGATARNFGTRGGGDDGSGGGDGRAQSAPPKRRDAREVVFNLHTRFEGTCVECGHLHLEGQLCGKVADLRTLDACRCTRGRKIKTKFVSRAQKRIDRVAKLRAEAEHNAGFVCANDPQCGVSFSTDIDYFVHMREDCEFRKVECPNEGCGMTCLQRDLVFHQRYCVCRDGGGGGAAVVVRVTRDPQTNERIVTTEPRVVPGGADTAPAPVRAAGELSPARQTGMMSLFDLLDKDGDGFLTPAELAPLLRIRSGRAATEQEAMVQIRRADRDGDGRVSRREWLDFSRPLAALSEAQFGNLVRSFAVACALPDIHTT